MVAGPWFAVRTESERDWFDFGTVWWSDGGGSDGHATVQLKLEMEPYLVEVADAG